MPPGLNVAQHLPDDCQRLHRIRGWLTDLGGQNGKRGACSGGCSL
ncbi:hypothetical protein CSB90_7103 (plasmid) [Pseudomonas aeruginosa]|nr:hypothetical protein CSB90_7103 [Pseudomonas aeruginosa]